MVMRSVIMALVAATAVAASGASKIRLIYGKGWDRAGESVCKALESSEFKSAARGKYVAECLDESTPQPIKENLGSVRLPVIFALDEKDRCYCVIESVPRGVSAKAILKKVMAVDKKRQEIEAKGSDTPDQCGELLLAMERYVGGPRRVISKGFYEDVYLKLKKLDPEDNSGWQRHFALGEELEKRAKSDGLELVTKANDFREKHQIPEGEKWIAEEMKKPRKRLTKEQQQALLMMKFALLRDERSRDDEMNELLGRIAALDEATFWGTAALGWLNMRKKPPLSLYWGWRKGDLPPPKFSTEVKYGVSHYFRRAGEYTVEFLPDDGAVEVESVTLKVDDEVIATLKKPPFTVKISRAQAGKVSTMIVKGTCAKDTTGKFKIERRILRPRKVGK